LKHKERLSYDCIGIRAADENNGASCIIKNVDVEN